MRHMIEFPNRRNCQSYRCGDCGWRHDVRLFGHHPVEFWLATRSFEVHDCSKYRQPPMRRINQPQGEASLKAGPRPLIMIYLPNSSIFAQGSVRGLSFCFTNSSTRRSTSSSDNAVESRIIASAAGSSGEAARVLSR
jgi:hypothetical protein